jgi:hypothetical protein
VVRNPGYPGPQAAGDSVAPATIGTLGDDLQPGLYLAGSGSRRRLEGHPTSPRARKARQR